MPEGQAIGGIDGVHGVIAPPARVKSLGAAAIGHDGLALTEVIWRIGGKATGITNTREDRRIRRRIADGRVSILIHGYAGHKAP